jgi:hypothetical protein
MRTILTLLFLLFFNLFIYLSFNDDAAAACSCLLDLSGSEKWMDLINSLLFNFWLILFFLDYVSATLHALSISVV